MRLFLKAGIPQCESSLQPASLFRRASPGLSSGESGTCAWMESCGSGGARGHRPLGAYSAYSSGSEFPSGSALGRACAPAGRASITSGRERLEGLAAPEPPEARRERHVTHVVDRGVGDQPFVGDGWKRDAQRALGCRA